MTYFLIEVLAEKGSRSVSQAASAERGSLVTMVGIINAQGNHLPPIYVFPRKRFKDAFLAGGAPGCVGLLSKSGWMTAELFIDVFKHIQFNTNASVENPILLIMDNHISHCSIEAIIFSKNNGIVLLSLPQKRRIAYNH